MERLFNTDLIINQVINGRQINSKGIVEQIEPFIHQYFKKNDVSHPSERFFSRRIALIIPYNPLYETGGLEIGTMKFADGLTKLGNHVEIISRGEYANRDLTGTRVSPDGINIHGVGSGIEEIVPYIFKRHADFDVVQWMEIFPPVPEEKHVYNDKAEQQYLASIVLRALGTHTFLYVATSGNVTNRGVNNPNWRDYKDQRLNQYLRAGIEGFDMINSEISDEYSASSIKIKPEKRTVIPLGVDTDMFKPVANGEKFRLRESMGLPKEKTIFICPGRFVKRKRQDFLFSVWQSMPENFKKSAILLFVGGKAGKGQPDSMYDELMEKIKSYRNEGNSDVISVDLVLHEQMVQYIQASDAMIFPSEREGLGMVVLETMACGKPVFASNIPGVRDIIQTKDTGTLFEPNNSEQVRIGLTSFLDSPDIYLQKSRKAREFVIHNWSWESISKKLNKFYERF